MSTASRKEEENMKVVRQDSEKKYEDQSSGSEMGLTESTNTGCNSTDALLKS